MSLLERFFLCVVILFVCYACSDSNKEMESAFVFSDVMPEFFEVESNNQQIKICDFSASDLWSVAVDFGDMEPWLEITPQNGGEGTHRLSALISENVSDKTRNAIVKLLCKRERIEFHIIQQAGAKGETGTSTPEPENPEQPKSKLVSQIGLTCYDRYMQETGQAKVVFTYHGGELMSSQYHEGDDGTKTEVITKKQVASHVTYKVENVSGENSTIVAELDGQKRFLRIDGWQSGYSTDGYLTSVSNSETEYILRWREGFLSGINFPKYGLSFKPSDIQNAGNIDLALMLEWTNDKESILSKAIFFEKERWGIPTAFFPETVSGGKVLIEYIYAIDETGYVQEVHEFRTDGYSSVPLLTRLYKIEYN